MSLVHIFDLPEKCVADFSESVQQEKSIAFLKFNPAALCTTIGYIVVGWAKARVSRAVPTRMRARGHGAPISFVWGASCV
jgi:hypothetical protein